HLHPATPTSFLHPPQPFLVIARAQIIFRRHLLDAEARLVDVPLAPGAAGAGEGEDAAFPRLVEDRLVLLALDRAESVHPAHVVDAVHRFAPAGTLTRATPIMAS